MNHRYIQGGEANHPGWKQAKGWISKAQGANQPGGERARRRTSQRANQPGAEQARGEPAKGQKSHNSFDYQYWIPLANILAMSALVVATGMLWPY